MSLKGATIICLNNNGQSEKILKPEGKTFRFGYYANSNYMLETSEAKGIHCEINADAFNRITIINYCKKNPITINGFPVKNKRPLFHNNKIKILNNEFIWQFSKTNKRKANHDVVSGSADIYNKENVVETPEKQISEIFEQPPQSEPWGKRKKFQISRRLSVHSFAYCIGKEEFDQNNTVYDNSSINTIINSSGYKENIVLNQVSNSNDILSSKCTPKSQKNIISSPNIRRRTFDCVTPIKTIITDTTLMKLNTSIYKEESMTPQAKLELCKSSDVLVTSYSPNTLNKNKEPQSFAIIKTNKNTPQSVYGTPRSVLSERNNEDSNDCTNFMSFSTPQHTRSYAHNSSMYLIDLTTPAIKQKTPIKQNIPSPLLKSALKNSIHNSIKKSVQKLKTNFATVLEEPCSPVNISGGKKKYPVTPSTLKNTNSIRKSLNMSITMKDKLVNTSNKITPLKICKNKNDLNTNSNIPTMEESDIESDDFDEYSIIEVTDDSIYSNKSTPIICNKSQQKENEDKIFCKNTSQITPKSTSSKKLPTSFNASPLSLKRLSSVKQSSSSNLSSSSILTNTPLRRSFILAKNTSRTTEKNRLSYRPSNVAVNITPLKKSVVPTSTPLRTNIKSQKSVELKNRSLSLLAKKTPSCGNLTNSNISTPINSKNTVAIKQTNLCKKNSILKSSKISNTVEYSDTNKSINVDLECGNESELNQTFTIETEENKIHENTKSNENLFGTEKILKATKSKENIHFNDFTGVRELLMTPKKDIVINLVGIKELVNTPKNIDINMTVAGITELFQTPINSSDYKTQLIQSNSINSNSLSKNEDQTLKIISPQNKNNSVMPEIKLISNENTEDTDYISIKNCETKIEENNYEKNLSAEEKFDKLIGKPTITKQYSPSKKHVSPKRTCTILNDPESPKSDIQEWIDNLNESCISKTIEIYENCSNAEIPEAEKLKYDEDNIPVNVSIRDLITSTNENFLDETKSVFSEELVMSDKSENEEFTNFQSTPKIKNALSRTYAVAEIKPIRRSSRNFNKSIGCKQCLTPPNFPDIKKLKTDFQDIRSITTPNKRQKNIRNTPSKNLSKNIFELHNKEKHTVGQEASTEECEMELAFENFNNQPNYSDKIVKTPQPRKNEIKNQNNRKTLGNQTSRTSFNLKAAKEDREMELAFEKFNDQSNFSEVKAKTPQPRKNEIKNQNNRKTLGNHTSSTSFNLEAAKEEREMELAFKNFNDQPNFFEEKAKTPDSRKNQMKNQNNRKTLGNQTASTSFDLEAAKKEREMELAFKNFNDQPNFSEEKAKTPDSRNNQMKNQNNRKTLGNQTASTSFDLEAAKEEREMELAFENFNDQPNFSEEIAKTPQPRKNEIKNQNNRKTLGNQTSSTSFNLKAAKEDREMELAFEKFNYQSNFSEVKAKTPQPRKNEIKNQNNRKTLGNKASSTSFNLEAAKEEREMELAFENFNDQPNFSEEIAKTPQPRKNEIKNQNNRKTLGNQTSSTSFNLKAAKEDREMELAFEKFNYQSNFSEVKAKTPQPRKNEIKNQNNRKTLGNQADSTSFDLETAKEEHEMELAFEKFNDQPNFFEVKAKTPQPGKNQMKNENNRKTLGNSTASISFNLEAAKEEREMELAFENFNDQPNFSEEKAKTPDLRKNQMKNQNNRKTLGNQTASTSFNLEAAKEEREMELAFENFNDQPNFSEEKAKTPQPGKNQMKNENNRKTLGNLTASTSFNLEAAKEEREMQLAFENFNDQPNFSEEKAKTPQLTKNRKQNNRKTLGNQTATTTFNLKAAKEQREMELAFENFDDQPNFAEVKAKTPEHSKNQMKNQNNRKTLGNQTASTSFNLEAAKEEREMELAFENFNDQPNFSEEKAKTPDLRKNQMKNQNNRKTLGNQTASTSFDIEAAKEEREMELAFENFNDQPNFSEEKAKTPDSRKTQMKNQNNRKTLGNQTASTSFDLEAAKKEREMELAFKNFNDQPIFSEEKAKTPDLRKNQMKNQNNRKTLGNQTASTSFDIEAAKEEREMELAFENFNDQPNFSEEKAKTPDSRKNQMKNQNNRKTLGNQTASTSFDLEAAKKEREMELAFKNFNDQPNFSEEKAKTPDSRKNQMKNQNNRKTLGNQTASTSFDLEAAKEEREMELAFENFNDQPNFSEEKAKTPDLRKNQMKNQNNRKTLGNQTASTSFDIEAAKEEREMELAFENFNDQPNFSEEKAKTPDTMKNQMKNQNNRKTLGNQTASTSFDLEAAKEEREMEVAFEKFNYQPNFSEVKAKTPQPGKNQMKNEINRKTLGNQTVSTSFDLEAAKEEREMELAFENFNDQPNFSEEKAKTPDTRKNQIKNQNNRKTLGNQADSTSFDLEAAKEEREMELAFEEFNYQPNFSEVKAKTPQPGKNQMKNQNKRKTLGNQADSTSFDLEEERVAFENSKKKDKTPEWRKNQTGNQRNRKTLGNQVASSTLNLDGIKSANHATVEQVEDMLTCCSPNVPNKHDNHLFDYDIPNNIEDTLLQLNTVEEIQIKKKESEENKNMLENRTTRRLGRTRKLVNDAIEIKSSTEEEIEFIESIPIKRTRRVRNPIHNIGEEIAVKKKYSEKTKENIKRKTGEYHGTSAGRINDTAAEMPEEKNGIDEEIDSLSMKSRGKNMKEINETVEEGQNNSYFKEDIKPIESTPAKARGRTRKQINNKSEDDQENINIRKHIEKENITVNKPTESTPAKPRGRTRKQINNKLEDDQENINVIKSTESENINVDKPTESTPAKPRGRTRKQINNKSENDQENINVIKNIEKENITVNKPTESTPAKPRGRTRKQINNKLEDDQENINVIKPTESENINVNKSTESTPAKPRGRTRKQINNQLEDDQENINVIKPTESENINVTKPTESTPAKPRGRTRKQINNKSENDQENINVINPTERDHINVNKSTESTPVKPRGRSRKQINKSEDDQDSINVIRPTESENINVDKPTESIPVKPRGRTRKQINNKLENDQENKNVIKPTESENINVDKPTESTPAKPPGRTRKQINNTSGDDQENINVTAENIKPSKSTPSARGRIRNKINNIVEEMQLKKEEDKEVVINNTPVKSRGRTRKQQQAMVDNIDVNDDSKKLVNKNTPPKDQITKNIIEEFRTPQTEEMQLKKEEDKEVVIKNTPVKSRGRTRKQQQAMVDNIDVNDDSKKLVNKNTPPKAQITKNIIEEFRTPQTPITRSRRNLKVVCYSEKNNSFTQTLNSTPVLNKEDLNSDDITINNKLEEKIAENKIKNRRNKIVKQQQVDKIIETKTVPAKRVLRANSVISTPNSETVVTRRNKRKISNENDNSNSEGVVSAESFRLDRRRRLQSEDTTNSEEDDSQTVKRSTRAKRSVDEIPVESDISAKRVTRKRK